MKCIQKLVPVLVLLVGGFVLPAQDMTPVLRALYGEEPEKAKALLLKMATANMGAQEVCYRLGNLYYAEGKADSARHWYSAGIKPDDKVNYNFAGMAKLALDAGDEVKAQELMDKLTMNGRTKDAKVYIFIGEAWMTSSRGNLDKAISAFQEAQELDYRNWESHILMGDAYQKKLDASNAITSYEHALDKNPGLALPYVKVGQVYMRTSGSESIYKLALEYFTKAYQADSSFGLAARELADFNYYRKNYPEAIRLYRRYIEITGTSNEKKARLAGFYFMNKIYEEATVLIEDVLKHDPAHVYMNRLLGYIKFEQGKYDEGVVLMREFFEHADTSILVSSDYSYYAKLLEKTGNDSMAVVMFRSALSLDSTDTDITLALAKLLYDQKKYIEAAAVYEQAIRLGKAGAIEYFALGKSWFFGKEYVNADTAFAQVTRLVPENATGHLWRAKANVQLDPLTADYKALPHYQRFFELNPDPAKYSQKDLIDANTYMGAYFVKQDDLEAACPHWQDVQKLDPDNENAKKFLEQVNCPPPKPE